MSLSRRGFLGSAGAAGLLIPLEILPCLRTEVFGYNGIFPGPTINARSGRCVVVRTRNVLPVPISTHLHGGRTPPDSDGYPTDVIPPVTGWSPAHQHGGDISEGTREYVYPSQQRAATLWYHDHRMDFTGPQVWRGLAGFHQHRDDDEEDALPLPSGPREVPLIITDQTFAEYGSFVYPSIDPDLRLRLLNASNARRYRLELDPEPDGVAPFIQIGSDGGLLEAPRELNSIYLTPAERFDTTVVLRWRQVDHSVPAVYCGAAGSRSGGAHPYLSVLARPAGWPEYAPDRHPHEDRAMMANFEVS